MDIKTFVKVISVLPPHIAVLAKGPTGIGKSQIVHQIAKKLGYPVLDKRLAYMTEGDIVGLPELIDGVTRFAPVDWIVKACSQPVILFLDELNRATLEVQQCAFQLVLDRELNGHHLHPETRVYVAINEGSNYQVSEMDPALLRRFYVAELEPTNNDWFEWAENNPKIDSLLLEFLKKYPAHLRHEGEFEPGKVYPNPASWTRLSETLIYADIAPSKNCGKESYNHLTLSIAKGFVGESTAAAFADYIANYETKFSAEDVLNDYDKKKNVIDKLTNDKKNDLIGLIGTYIKDKDISVKQAENIHKFIITCSDEMIVNFMNLALECGHPDNLRKIHKLLGRKVVELVNFSTK